MPESLAFDITRLLFENQSELVAIHPEAKNLSLQSATKDPPRRFIRVLSGITGSSTSGRNSGLEAGDPDPRSDRALEVQDVDELIENASRKHRLAGCRVRRGISPARWQWVCRYARSTGSLASLIPRSIASRSFLTALVLTFLQYPARRGRQSRVSVADWLLVGLTLVAFGWPLADFSRFVYRAANPRQSMWRAARLRS